MTLPGSTELEQQLLQMTVPDSMAVKAAESWLKEFMTSPQSIPMLFQQLEVSQHASARQLSAILLRKRINGFWKKQSIQTKIALKNMLLDRIVKEPHRAVQIAIGGVVASVAKHEVPIGQWNELLEFLHKCSMEKDSRFRELSMLIFRVLCDYIGSSMRVHFRTLIEIFARGLEDPESSSVREEALRSLGALFISCEEEEEFIQYRNIVPGICKSIETSVGNGDESTATFGFEVLDDLAESPVPVLEPHIPALVAFSASAAGSHELSINLRERACNLLVWIIKFQGKTVMEHNLVNQLMSLAFNMLVQESEEDDDENEDGVSSTQAMALEILDEIFLSLPSSMLYQPALEGVLQLLRSHVPYQRSSGQLVLFVMAEGCAELMKRDTVELLKLVISGLQDPDSSVRCNASSAMAQFSEHLQPNILDHHAIVVPCVLGRLEGRNEAENVRKRLVTTLDAFCGELSAEQLSPYLQRIVQLLATLLSEGDPKTQERALAAICGISTAAKSMFVPFLSHFMSICGQVMNLSHEDGFMLRACATKAVGCMALAVGRDQFSPYLDQVIQLALQGLAIDSCEIRESTFTLFSCFAELLGRDFVSALPIIMPHLIQSMDSNDGLMISGDDEDDDKAFGGSGYEFNEEEDEEEGEDEHQNLQYSIMSGYIDEKIAALQCVSALFQHCGSAMLQFIEPLISSIETLSEYLHESVRIIALFTYDELFKVVVDAWGPNDMRTKKVWDSVFPTLLTTMGVDFDKGVASVAVDVLARTVLLLGGIEEDKKVLMLQSIDMVVKGNTPAQKYAREDACAVDDDLDELLDSSGDLLAAFAKTQKQAFAKDFDKLLPSLMQALKNPSTVAGHIASIVGTIGEVILELGPATPSFAPKLLPMLAQATRHPSAVVQRSSVFAVGSFFQIGGESMKSYSGEFLTVLLGICQQNVDNAEVQVVATRDNACSALGKLMMACPGSVPMDRCVAAFLQCLPLREDLQENEYVYPVLGQLIVGPTRSLMSQHVPRIMEIMVAALTTAFAPSPKGEDETEEVKQSMCNVVKALASQQKDAFDAVIARMSPEQRKVFEYALSV